MSTPPPPRSPCLPHPPSFLVGQVVVSHHGRPTALDLHSADTLRYPLLSLPRSTCPADARARTPGSVSSRDSAIIESAAGTPAVKETDHESSTRELNVSSDPKPQDIGESGGGEEDPPSEIDRGFRYGSRTIAASSTAANNAAETSTAATSNAATSTTASSIAASSSSSSSSDGGNRIGDTAAAAAATNGPNNGGETPHGHNSVFKSGKTTTSHRHPHRRQDQLIPARLVAVLLDGAGKGWIAARRLLSVREVGAEALAEAGLGFADVDREQEVKDGRSAYHQKCIAVGHEFTSIEVNLLP